MKTWPVVLGNCDPGERLRVLQAAGGPRDGWRKMGDEAACVGKMLFIKACVDVRATRGHLRCWFRGIRLRLSEQPKFAALDGHP